MKTAVITGSTGFIGTELCKELLTRGWLVQGVARSPYDGRFGNVGNYQHFKLEFSGYPELENLIAHKADAFFHLAWTGLGPMRTESDDHQLCGVNISAAAQAAIAARNSQAKRFIFCGSAYQLKRRKSANENRHVFDVYGASKQAASDICERILFPSDTAYQCALLGLVFGPGDYSQKSINRFIDALRSGRDLDLLPEDSIIDFLYIQDAVRGLATMAEANLSNIDYHVGKRLIPPFGSLLTEMKQTLKSSSALNFGKFDEPSFVDYRLINLDALYDETGFECLTPLEQAVRETARWRATHTQ